MSGENPPTATDGGQDPRGDSWDYHDMDVDYHLNRIEYHTSRIRGQAEEEISPSDFRLPTGEDLRRMRETCGLTLRDVSERLDYQEQTIGKVERGTSRPSLKLLGRLMTLYRQEWPRGDLR